MYDLKCGQKNCKYNHGYCCCAKDVAVSQGTLCTTYEKAETDLKNGITVSTDDNGSAECLTFIKK